MLGFAYSCKDKQTNPQDVATKEMKTENNSTNEDNTSQKTILCFGNSLTAGFGLEEDEAWPSLMQERLDSLDYDYQVINAGLSGETTSGGLNRIQWVMNQKIDIMILELGANDMLRGLDVSGTQDNLEAILAFAKTENPEMKILIAGMMSPPNMGSQFEQQFNEIFPALAQKDNVTLIPFFLEGVAGIPELNLPDGKHPNAKGQQVVLENVWMYLEGLL